MSKKNIIIAIAVIVIAGLAYFFMGSSSASCTLEEYDAKAAILKSKVLSLQKTNPELVEQALAKMQEANQQWAQNPSKFSNGCQILDEVDAMLE